MPRWEHPSLLGAPRAWIGDRRGNELSSLIHSLLQDQAWPVSHVLGGAGNAGAGPGCRCPLGLRVLPSTPGR